MKILLTGGSSGIGHASAQLLLTQGHTVITPTRQELDLNNPSNIDHLSLEEFDAVVNCAGANVGTHLGFYNNTLSNQLTQLNVNFITPLMLAKKYSQDNPNGHFVYISSISIDTPRLYNIINSTSKAALQYAMNVIRVELPNFIVSEICPGKTKTNMLRQNYNNTKTESDIDAEYESQIYLTPQQVAKCVVIALEQKLDLIKIVPHE